MPSVRTAGADRAKGWRPLARRGLLAGAGAAGVFAAYHYGSGLANIDVPVARARFGDLVVTVEARGSVESAQPVVLAAPDGLRPRIAALAAAGRLVHAGTAVVEFEDEGLALNASPTLRAPAEGVVRILPNPERAANSSAPSALFQPGDTVAPGTPVVELDSGSGPVVAIALDDVDRARASAGQSATVRIDALPDRPLRGRLDSVGSIAGPDRLFPARVALDEFDPRVRPGMLASVTLAVETIPRRLLIPARAVFVSGGQPVVYVQRGHEFEMHAIITGPRNDTDLAVARGLSAGDSVAIENPADVVKKP